MNKSIVINAIHQILEQELNIPQIQAFHPSARLNEDLYLDSVLLMELMVNLELKLDIEVPDNSLNKKDFKTVDSLVDFFLNHKGSKEEKHLNSGTLSVKTVSELSASEPIQEEFEDIKVHCFVSCICEIIKANEKVDHRPFYFGVWDSEVVINDQGRLDYHSPSINHDFFIEWYQKLYGVPLTAWYQKESTKNDNIKTFIDLLEDKTKSQQVMVMLDMYRLPERENKFNHNPFPHYVLIEKTEDPNMWHMSDPDFRWEGLQEKIHVIHAIESNAVAGGYCFDSQNVQETHNKDIHDYFLACFNDKNNALTDSVRKVIDLHLSENFRSSLFSPHINPGNLDKAMTQLPVLSIRKYAYEHGLAFFWREGHLTEEEFESWCDVIEELVSTYKNIQYRIIKIANLFRQNSDIDQILLTETYVFLDQQDTREFQIKARLFEAFQQWSKCVFEPSSLPNKQLLKVNI